MITISTLAKIKKIESALKNQFDYKKKSNILLNTEAIPIPAVMFTSLITYRNKEKGREIHIDIFLDDSIKFVLFLITLEETAKKSKTTMKNGAGTVSSISIDDFFVEFVEKKHSLISILYKSKNIKFVDEDEMVKIFQKTRTKKHKS